MKLGLITGARTRYCFLILLQIHISDGAQNSKGLYTNLISDGFETIPQKVHKTGEYSSHNLTSYHHEGDVYFNVTINNVQHLLVIQPAKHFMGPAILVERWYKNTRTRYRPTYRVTGCHYEGVVHGELQSMVALSTCNGLAGTIYMQNERYYIEPKHSKSNIVKPGHVHIVYKRSAISNRLRKKRKKRRQLSRNCGTKEPRKITRLEWQKQLGKVKVQEKRHKRRRKFDISSKKISDTSKHRYNNLIKRRRRSISKPQFVEALLVADSSMVDFHEDGDVETYLLTIMNMVSSLYTDPSLGNLVKIVVVKIILIDDSQAEPNLHITTNADFTLKSFCKWQKSLNPGNDSHPHHHDVAILITRQDICVNANRSCNTLGVAHVGGMCTRESSCSVNEDNGITLAHTVAHEMGHNLGMFHDTEKIGCRARHGNTQHIMTPSFQADTVGVSWSTCSRRDITYFLDKGLGECLQDMPQDIGEYEYPELPAGAMYDANYQCRLQFGEHATMCSPKDEICLRLWCTVNETCTTLLIPAAPGTNCGKHMWCQDQKCVPIMEPPAAIDGGWGEWTSWSECSRSCGVGVSISERQCDHPKPAAGGWFCVGIRRKYKTCNTDPCPINTPSFRAVQCLKYNNHTYEGKNYEWIPYFEQSEPCKLYCNDANDTVMVSWSEYVEDGTPCNVGTRDICISGICRRVGCDWVVDSKTKEDECGICQGDGTKCDIVNGTYIKQSNSPGYREVVVIPAGARNIRIVEREYSENYISISSALHSKFYLNGKRHITLPGEYVIAGSIALYERKTLEKLRIPGPIEEAIVVLIVFRGRTLNPGIKYKYSIWKSETTRQVKYTWTLNDWSQCSATCGSGIQSKKSFCRESEISSMKYALDGVSTVVDSTNCKGSPPLTVTRSCNDFPCATHWWVGPWQSCPVTCSDADEKDPVRRRSVMCVDGQEMALQDKFCDCNVKPVETEICESLLNCTEDN